MSGPSSTPSILEYIGNDNNDGMVFGRSALTSKTAVNGATPILQRSNPQQALVGQNLGAGVITTYSTTQSPTQVLTITTTESLLTVTGIGATDLVYVNKPTNQAGLGIVGVRASAANQIGITFGNYTGATLTPTASQVYTVVAIKGLTVTATLTPAACLANTSTEQTFAVAALAVGMLVQVNKPTNQAGLGIVGCRVVSNGVLGITFLNVTGATLTPTAAEVYGINYFNGLNVINNVIAYGINVGTLTGCATITVAEQTLTATGLLANDMVMGVSKPTTQAGLGIAGYRISAADTLALAFVNPTVATLTPTASQVYNVGIFRLAPTAPLKLYAQTLTPTSVAANTTAEQTFTVTGLVAGSAVFVNKPSNQLGLGIVGWRVSAADTLAITFGNSTGTAIVPTSESYTIGNFQVPAVGTDTSFVSQAVSAAQNNELNLTNELATSLVNFGIIRGS